MIKPVTITAAKKRDPVSLGQARFFRVRFSTAPFLVRINGEELVLDMGDEFQLPPGEVLGNIVIENLNSVDDLTVEYIASRFPIHSAFFIPRTVFVGSSNKDATSTYLTGHTSATFKGVRLGLRRKQIIISNLYSGGLSGYLLSIVDVSTLSGGTRLGGDVVAPGQAHTFESDGDVTIYNTVASNNLPYSVGEIFYCPINYGIPT